MDPGKWNVKARSFDIYTNACIYIYIIDIHRVEKQHILVLSFNFRLFYFTYNFFKTNYKI